ncbi:hypothetical protein HDU83_005261 [Entophlyctis luteolus]|nr:hypothetical protein HDU83_005261 [Entophlyctis luteolus]KAJ3381634.1 hypothetical protein HDU84_004979 [Entophlyctis sp. JEL0112]
MTTHSHSSSKDGRTWGACDEYTCGLLVPEATSAAAPFAAALASHERHGLPQISVSAAQGKWLQLMVTATRARRVLEIGTLAAYSTLWLAAGLGLGQFGSDRVTIAADADPNPLSLPPIVTLEVSPVHARVARENLLRAGLDESKVQIRVADAVQSLKELINEGQTFDFIFLDADKEGYAQYFELCLHLANVGTTIVSDNVVRQGQISDPNPTDSRVRGVQQFLQAIAVSPHVQSSVLQTVGSKGYDGLAFTVVVSKPTSE